MMADREIGEGGARDEMQERRGRDEGKEGGGRQGGHGMHLGTFHSSTTTTTISLGFKLSGWTIVCVCVLVSCCGFSLYVCTGLM